MNCGVRNSTLQSFTYRNLAYCQGLYKRSSHSGKTVCNLKYSLKLGGLGH